MARVCFPVLHIYMELFVSVTCQRVCMCKCITGAHPTILVSNDSWIVCGILSKAQGGFLFCARSPFWAAFPHHVPLLLLARPQSDVEGFVGRLRGFRCAAQHQLRRLPVVAAARLPLVPLLEHRWVRDRCCIGGSLDVPCLATVTFLARRRRWCRSMTCSGRLPSRGWSV